MLRQLMFSANLIVDTILKDSIRVLSSVHVYESGWVRQLLMLRAPLV